MKIILAIDSFKECLTSEEVEKTFSDILTYKGHKTISIPMSDGGEGMLNAFTSALHGKIVKTETHNPLMKPITAEYGIANGDTAIIETAKACGLTLINSEERNPLITTTYGVGEMIADAIRKKCRNFIIGLGGSATSDAGIGMLKALAEQFTTKGNIKDLKDNPDILQCNFILASDVRNPLYGENGAANIFGRQKGATKEMIEELDNRTKAFADFSFRLIGKDMSNVPGSGAAGGLGYAFMQYFNTEIRSGADFLLDLIDFDKIIDNADLIITGEGHADRQTLMGKLPERILKRARRRDIPIWLIAGKTNNTKELLEAGFDKVESITPEEMDINEAIKPENAKNNITIWIENQFTI